MMKITSWPAQQCKLSRDNFNQLFNIQNTAPANTPFIKPLLASLDDKNAEILIGHPEQLTTSKIPLYIIPDNTSQFERIELATDYYLTNHTLNHKIISNLINFLDIIEISPHEFKRFVTIKLKISPNPKTIETYKKFNSINSGIVTFLIDKKAPFKLWEYLINFPLADQNLFEKLIRLTKPSMSNFLKIVENLAELKKLNSDSSILSKITTLLDDETNEQLSAIKALVFNHRYPTISSHLQKITELFDSLETPANLRFRFDQGFESKAIKGYFTIKDISDIESLRKFLQEENIQILTKILKQI